MPVRRLRRAKSSRSCWTTLVINQAVVFAMPDARLGEDVAAAVVLHSGHSVTSRSIIEFAATRLAEFKLPRKIWFLPELPRGATGKLMRVGMAAFVGAMPVEPDPPSPDSQLTEPTTHTELLLSWASSALRAEFLEHIGVDDDYFGLGGDLLSGLQLAFDIEQASGIKVTVLDLFQAPTIRQLARFIDGQDADGKQHPASLSQSSRGDTTAILLHQQWPAVSRGFPASWD